MGGWISSVFSTLQIKTKKTISEDNVTVKEENEYIVKDVLTWADDFHYQHETKRYKKLKADDRQLELDFDS